MKLKAALSGPIGLPASQSNHANFAFLFNHLSATHPAARLLSSGHIGSSAHSSVLLWIVLPMLALCAVKIPMPEELLSSDIRSRLGSVFAKHQSIADLTVQPMRRRPGSRHVFSYKLLVTDQRTGKHNVVELVGKQDTARAVGKAAKEFEAMRLLWSAGFGEDNRFRIPQPLHHFEDLRLIIQEKAHGAKMRVFLGDGDDTSLNHARMAGLWLAKLHKTRVACPAICTYENEKASLEMFVAALATDQPQLESELRHYAAVAAQRFDGFHRARATHVHGDFHPDHIYVGNGFVTVIDFERFGIGDPARDLGSFVAHMRTTAYCLGKSIESANQEIVAFLESYFGAVPKAQADAIGPRVAPYVALSSLEALYYVASVLKVKAPARISLYRQCVQESGLPPVDAASPRSKSQTASA
jgi:tRNA A-37 threonylcarbamoyl transferase component Bud32